MKTTIISTKEIRNDLEGFLRKLKQGQTIQVMYRSKPLVTLAAQPQTDLYTAPDAGTPAAIKRSIDFINSLPKHEPVFDPNKSIKELYKESRTL